MSKKAETTEGLQPLDFTGLIAVDSPEVEAVKKKVLDVAKKYKKKHGWCDVVDKALAEMGLTPQPLQVDITLLGRTERVKVNDTSALVGKTAQQQAEHLLANHVTNAYIGGTYVPLPVSLVTEMKIHVPPPPFRPAIYPDGILAMSMSGRVWHVMENDEARYAKCGTRVYVHHVAASTEDEAKHKVCKSCSMAAAILRPRSNAAIAS